ncbi:hypothetical protein [Coleofasciculus sp. FACHB-SPT9]|nr:hypothetical protein [Coleofasciculus sp. FACHB-SPT9]
MTLLLFLLFCARAKGDKTGCQSDRFPQGAAKNLVLTRFLSQQPARVTD